MPENKDPGRNGRQQSGWVKWEKHFTALLVAIVALVGWRIFDTTEKTSDKVVELDAKLTAFQTNIDDWKEALRNTYNTQIKNLDRRIIENRGRIERIERRMEDPRER